MLKSLLAATLIATAAVGTAATSVDAAGNVYYVSCSGSDSNSGRSKTKAWRTITHANKAELQPGDKLLLQRGCTWTGQRLDVTWSGTSSKKILIANYGSGAKPLIRDGKNSNVKITGKHVNVRGLRSHYRPMNTVACNQSIGEVYGFNLTGGASNVTISYSETSGATAGIHMSKNSGNNKALNNYIHDNNTLTSFGANPAKDLGAWGVLVRSDGNEVAYNRIENNKARCQNQGYKLMSNSVEIYEARNTYVHHNRSKGDRVFSELGSSASKKAENNVFEFNTFQTTLADSRFITTRGPSDSFGPVRTTRVLHNTTYQTGVRSQAVVCGGGCGSNILELRNNVLVAKEKALFASGNVQLGPNVVWSPDGELLVQVLQASSSTNAAVEQLITQGNPRFQNANSGNFRLKKGSPAINSADGVRIATLDVARQPVKNGAGDQGAFESNY